MTDKEMALDMLQIATTAMNSRLSKHQDGSKDHRLKVVAKRRKKNKNKKTHRK